MRTSSPVLSVRVSAHERELLSNAAKQANTSLGDFVRRKAIEAAELEMMERRLIVIPADDWDRFEAMMNEPPRDVPELRRLAASRPVWES